MESRAESGLSKFLNVASAISQAASIANGCGLIRETWSNKPMIESHFSHSTTLSQLPLRIETWACAITLAAHLLYHWYKYTEQSSSIISIRPAQNSSVDTVHHFHSALSSSFVFVQFCVALNTVNCE